MQILRHPSGCGRSPKAGGCEHNNVLALSEKPRDDPRVPRTRRLLTVVALLLVTFMAAMEITVVSTAMPTVIADLGGIERYAWVFTAYIVASTVTVPILGKLADLYGRKPIMFVGIVLFLGGSVASGLSRSMTELILARTVQGIGAGGVQPMAMTILGDLYGPADRARIQGWFGTVWATAGMTGPLLGGLIVRSLSWHWVFFINVPFGVTSAAVLAVALHEQPHRRKHDLDIAGAALLAVAIVALLLGCGDGGQALELAMALVALVGFVVMERRAAEPVLPLSLLRQRVIAVSSSVGALIGGTMIATTTFLPLYVQAVSGGSPTDAGLSIAPMAIGWPIASWLTGRLLPKVGYRPLVRLGTLLTLTASLLLASLLRPDSSPYLARATSVLLGLGLGFANTTLLVSVQGTVEWEQRGVATACTLLFRTLGGAVAVGTLGATLSSALRTESWLPEGAVSSLLGPTHGRDLAEADLTRLSGVLDASLMAVFLSIAAVSVVAFVVSLLFPKMTVAAERGQVA